MNNVCDGNKVQAKLIWDENNLEEKIKTKKKRNYDKTLKDRFFLKIICCDQICEEDSKTKIVTKLKDSNCDKTQKL